MHLTRSAIARVCLAWGILLAGCGSSGSSGGDATAPFVGTWTFSSGSIQPMCSVGISPFDLTGDTMIVTKMSGNQVQAQLKGTGIMCDVNFTVSGDTATVVAGQTCALSTTFTLMGTSMTIAANVMISTWTLTVSGNSMSMAMTGSATANVLGVPLSCSPMGNGSATRAPADGGAGG